MLETAARCALALSVLVTAVCASSSTEARRRGYYHQYYRYLEQNAVNDATQIGSAAFRGRGSGFARTVDQLIRGCSQEAAALKNWPFDYLAKTAAADESQRNALQQMQNTAGNVADTLASKCPKDIPAALSVKLDALKQGIDAFIAALDALRPAVETFDATLDDEQKARLVATYTANNSSKEKTDQLRRASRNTYRAASTGQQELICESWAGALREWPTRQIEANMTLSDGQHAALYDVTASIYRAAGSLIAACPAEASFTPLGQIVSKRKRVDALAQAIGVIGPPLARFTDALDDAQKMRLATIVSSSQTMPQRRRSGDDD